MKIFACTGGGIRGIAVAGVLLQGEQQGKWHPEAFDAITGDSFGALIGAMVTNHWTPQAMAELFVETNFKRLLTLMPWMLRKPLLMASPLSLKKVARFIDSLGFQPSNRLFINTWDAELNQQVVYCEQKPSWAVEEMAVPIWWVERAFSELGYGTVITRSMALPGLVADSLQWMDGGLSEHPPLAFLPREAELLLINLGYAGLVPHDGDTVPRSLIDRAMYAYEVTASIRQRLIVEQFPHRWEINPEIYDVDSINFGLSRKGKLNLIQTGMLNTHGQWQNSFNL